ncbi:MAG: nuclear transport factor 2 family protein [Pseudomonadales bacterium]
MALISVDTQQAIIDLCARYSYHSDVGEAGEVAKMFVENGVFDGPPGRFVGHEAIEKFNVDLHQQLKGSMHFTDNHMFDEKDGYIRHRCYLSLHVAGEQGVKISLLTYDDEVVKDDNGRWKFRIRACRSFAP